VTTSSQADLGGCAAHPGAVDRADPWRTIMYCSPSGAAAKAVVDSAFNGGLSYAGLLTMAVYTVIFGFVAISLFPLGAALRSRGGIAQTDDVSPWQRRVTTTEASRGGWPAASNSRLLPINGNLAVARSAGSAVARSNVS